MSNPLQAFFGRIPLFSSLTSDELNEFIRAIQPTTLEEGALLFKEGDQGDAAYIIQSGTVEIFLERPEGHITLAELSTNAVIGEITLIDGQKRTAHARAVDSVSLYRLDKSEFDFLRRNLRPVAFKIMREISVTVCDRLRETNDLINHTLSSEIEQPKERDLTPPDEASESTKPGLLSRLAFWRNS